MQLVWSEGRFGAFTDDMGTSANAGETDSLIVSSRLTYERTLACGAVVFADLAVYQESSDHTDVTSGGATVLS